MNRPGKLAWRLKSNDTVFPITEGIDFLGYVTRPDHVRLRKRNKQKFARKMHKIKSKKRRQGVNRFILRAYETCRLQELIL